MTTAAEFPVYRSEAFAEDVLDFVVAAPTVEPTGKLPSRWLGNTVPAAAALLGVVFAAVPPRT